MASAKSERQIVTHLNIVPCHLTLVLGDFTRTEGRVDSADEVGLQVGINFEFWLSCLKFLEVIFGRLEGDEEFRQLNRLWVVDETFHLSYLLRTEPFPGGKGADGLEMVTIWSEYHGPRILRGGVVEIGVICGTFASRRRGRSGMGHQIEIVVVVVIARGAAA